MQMEEPLIIVEYRAERVSFDMLRRKDARLYLRKYSSSFISPRAIKVYTRGNHNADVTFNSSKTDFNHFA